jgi:hypothetical protein
MALRLPTATWHMSAVSALHAKMATALSFAHSFSRSSR